MLISINGLYGSGGNELGWALSEKTGWPVHDNELIRQAVADSGVDLREATLAFYDEDEQGAAQRPYGSAVLSLELDVLPIARDEDTPKKENYQSGLLAAFMDTTSVNNREGIPAVRERRTSTACGKVRPPRSARPPRAATASSLAAAPAISCAPGPTPCVCSSPPAWTPAPGASLGNTASKTAPRRKSW